MINTMDNTTLIQGKAIISTEGVIVTADEAFYRFAGPNTYLISDIVHQIDLEDFTYVLNNIQPYVVKTMVLRMKRFDNTYRWIIAVMKTSDAALSDKDYIEIEISDVINLNNHYQALTNTFSNKKIKKVSYESLPSYEEVLAVAQNAIDQIKTEQINLFYIVIDELKNIRKSYGDEIADELLNNISIILDDMIGERGCMGKNDANGFLVVLKNTGTEPSVRSFVESFRTQIKWLYLSKYKEMEITFTIGISEYPRNGKTYDIIYKKLKKAYDIAVTKGGKRYIIYKEELHGELTE